MSPSDYEMIEQGYDPPRMNEGELVYTEPGELAALRAQNAELVAALKGVLAEADRKTDAFDRARAALRYAAPAASMARPLEDENFALAANQCHDGYGDEWGNHRCRAIDRAVSECEFLAKRATERGEALKQIAEGQMVGYEAQTIARAALKEQP